MIPIGKIRLLALAGVASAGLLGGHSLTYLSLASSAGSQSAVLESSGHGYMDKATVLAAVLALMAFLFWIADGALKSRNRRPSLAGTAMVLGLVQVLGFVGQELLERLIAGAPMQDLGSILLVGLPLQLIVASVGAFVVTVLRKAGERIADFFSSTRPKSSGTPAVRWNINVQFNSALLVGGLRSRGPPVSLS